MVSVIIPLYNKERYIQRAIESVIAQTYKNYEIIVVDDGSTDASRIALEPYWDRIAYIWQENAGPGAARNRGASKSSGQYLAFLDADDYWLEGFLEHTVAFLEKYPEAGVVSTAYWRLRPSGRTCVVLATAKQPEGIVENFFKAYARIRFCCTGSVLIRKAVFVSLGGFREDLKAGEDVEFWCCLGAITTWGYITRPLAVYDETVPNSIVRGPIQTVLAQKPDLRDWERRILSLMREEEVGDYGHVRWRTVVNRLKLLIRCGEYQGARSLAVAYRAAFALPRRLALTAIAVVPDFMFGAIRRLQGWGEQCS